MKNNYKELCDILKRDNRLIDAEGNLLKNKIQEYGNSLDKELLKLLLSNELSANLFFKDVDGIKVFDKIAFTFIVNSKQFLPDSYTQFSQKIILVDEYGQPLKKNNDVVIEFPHKDCILEFDSTKESDERNEAYLNEIIAKTEIDCLLSPKVFCNATKYTTAGAEKVTEFNAKDNLIIKGNNLIGLSSLIPTYKGRVKLMYWDILFNTNNDKVPYNDSFKHSSWLTMMKNRIEEAVKLLDPEQGFLVIECDKNEDAYLTVLMDEIIGRDKHICTISVKSNNISGTKTQHKEKTILKNKDSILVYTVSDNPRINPQYTEKNRWDTHYNMFFTKDTSGKWNKERLNDVLIRDNIIGEKDTIKEDIIQDKVFHKYMIEHKSNIARFVNSISPELKKYSLEHPDEVVESSEESNPVYALNGQRITFLDKAIVNIRGEEKLAQLLGDLWTDIDFQNTQNEGNVSLPSGKKPEALIQRILSMFTDEDDIVLDAYFGSGTTGAVALKMKRQFIGIEQLPSHYDKAIHRLKSVINGDSSGISKYVDWQGGGSFVSFEVANNSNALIEKIQLAEDHDLNNIYDELQDSEFVLYRVDINKMNEQVNAFNELSIDDKRKFLISIVDKNQLYINYSDIDNLDYTIDENDKAFTRSFYSGGKE